MVSKIRNVNVIEMSAEVMLAALGLRLAQDDLLSALLS